MMRRPHGTPETEAGITPAQVGQQPADIPHRGIVAQIKVDFGAVELPSAAVQSLRNIQAARKELLPLTENLSTAAALAFQIKLREISLNEIRTIRARLRLRIRSTDVIARRTQFPAPARNVRTDSKQPKR